jgi:hypothetical protein
MVTSAPTLRGGGVPRVPGRRMLGGIIGGTLLAGGIAGELVATGHGIVVLAFVLVLVPVIVARHPDLAPAVVLFPALLIEQSPIDIGSGINSITDHLPLFGGLGPSHLDGSDVLLIGLFIIWVLRVAQPKTYTARSSIGTSLLALEAAVALGFVVGVAHHGDTRIAFLEMRPYVYIGATYFLASRLGTTERAVRVALWAVVVGSGLKSVQGLLVFLQVRHMDPRPDSVLAHEEALFLGVYILLVLALYWFEVPGRLRNTATLFLPFVVATDLANSRRTAFLILGVCFVVLTVLAYVRLPSRRPVLRRMLLCLGVFLAFYLPVFWNKTGAFGQPALAIHSLFSPNPRDASSDLYRVQEDANLKLNIAQGGPLGKGFGVPINYALPIVDIRDVDPLITWIPHDGLLYVVMRMGVLGAIAFWSVLAAGILSACRLLRSRNRELAAFGAIVVCVLIAYVLEGYKDQGFFYFRVALVVGTMLGLTQAALRREAANAETVDP